MAALTAFREPHIVTDLFDERDFSSFDARRLRYAILWSFYENTAFRGAQKWAAKYKVDHGLYKYIRNVYNPAYRLAEFWVSHVYGGVLDPAASDGDGTPSAIPILYEAGGETLQAAIARLWQWSRWQAKKDNWVRNGAVKGDVGLRVVDDTERERVYLEIVKPEIIKSVTLDPFGNVKAYTLEWQDDHPANPTRRATFTEECTRESVGGTNSDFVQYRTYLDGAPYPWSGAQDDDGSATAEWAIPYGFVPLVMTQHLDVGLEWGWSELHAGRSRIHEIDNLGSALDDQIMKSVNAPWLIAGQKKPNKADQRAASNTDPSTDRPEPGKDELQTFWIENPQAKAQALVAPLDLEQTSAAIQDILQDLEKQYPELRLERALEQANFDLSGRALRILRQDAEAKVKTRRAGYEDALVRGQQMAVAIGGFREYEGFQGFDLNSYAAGKLAHSIKDRPAFPQDPLDKLEIHTAVLTAAARAKDLSIPPPLWLQTFASAQGYDLEFIQQYQASEEYKARLDMFRLTMGDTRSLEEAQDG